jgi:hypothetical protein
MKFFESHDKELFIKISNIFTSDVQIYLKDFDFANTGRMSMINPFFELNHYINTSDYEFINIDEDFFKIYTELIESIKNFVITFSLNTTPTGNEMFQVAPSNEWYGSESDRLRQEANEINHTAEDLHSKIRNFTLGGKKRINMNNDTSSSNIITVHGGVVNASIGNSNTLTNNTQSEYNQKLDILINKILESSMQDKQEIAHQITQAKTFEDKGTVMKILGGLLTRGAETAGLVASIGSILSL